MRQQKLDDAFATFASTIHNARPIALRANASPADRAHQAALVERHMLNFAQFIDVWLTELAPDFNLSARARDYPAAVLRDVASDIRGALNDAQREAA